MKDRNRNIKRFRESIGRPEKTKFLILCEGEVTEPYYFYHLKKSTYFDNAKVDYATTYCPSCWWILQRFSKICKIQPQAKDLFELLL